MKRGAGKGKESDSVKSAEEGVSSLAAGLYVVATPIGNLADVTARARDVLARASVIAAEDTRVTRSLLAHLGIAARVVSVREHNERAAAAGIIDWIGQGKAVALVSDAGTPAVSDPGAMVVERVRAAGFAVVPVPGASALTAALSASGIAADGVVFAGFLPVKGAERRRRLAELAAGPWAIALFESPHRVVATVEDLHAALGERDVVIARELTKRFESIARVRLADAADWLRADADRQRGEFVLVIEGRAPPVAAGPSPDAVVDVLAQALPVSQAAALAAKITGAKRGDLYRAALARLEKRGSRRKPD